MPARQVDVAAYNAAGEIVASQSFPNHEWYDGIHPLIDSNEERAHLKVIRIEGKQYNYFGAVAMTWVAHYRADGSISELTEWRSDGSVTERQYPAIGSQGSPES